MTQDHIARWGNCRNWDRYSEEWGYCEGMETLHDKLKEATVTLMSPNEGNNRTQIEVGSFGRKVGLKNVFEVMKNCVAPLLDNAKVDTLKRKRDV